jgi:hypothetical protein
MMTTLRTLGAGAVLSLGSLIGPIPAQAQTTCNPGLVNAYLSHRPQYDQLVAALMPGGATTELDALNNELAALGSGATFADNQALYATLLTHARNIVATINTPTPVGGRVVITLVDGTVVVDTSKPDDLTCDMCPTTTFPIPPPTDCTCTGSKNSYGHFQRKLVNENHQSRIAIMDAQEWPCGIGLETKFSSSTGKKEHYVALRLASPAFGGHLDNTGTVRASLQASVQ